MADTKVRIPAIFSGKSTSNPDLEYIDYEVLPEIESLINETVKVLKLNNSDALSIVERHNQTKLKVQQLQNENTKLKQALTDVDLELADMLDKYQRLYIDSALVPYQVANTKNLQTEVDFVLLKQKFKLLEEQGTGH